MFTLPQRKVPTQSKGFQADLNQFIDPASKINSFATSVVDPDPHWFGSPRSGSVRGLRIRIKDQKKLTKIY